MSNLTQKQALEQAEAKITDLQGKVTAAEGLQAQLTDANTKLAAAEKLAGDEKARADKAVSDFNAATQRADKAENDLKAANEKVGDLEKTDKTAGGKATEQLASRGVNPPQKADADATETANGGGIEAVAEKFADPKTSMNEKRELLATHGEKLRAHVANLARRG